MKATPYEVVMGLINSDAFENKKPYPSTDRWSPEGRAMVADYRAEESRIIGHFREACEKAFGMAGHPKAELLWKKAWEHGHANGYRDVLFYYDDFAEFLR